MPDQRQAAPVSSGDDENRWSDAQSVLDRTPTASPGGQLAHWRRLRTLWVVGVVLGVIGLSVALVARFGSEAAGSAEDGPPWRVVTGLVLTVLATLLCVAGAVAHVRATRRRGAWRSPLVALNRAQRRTLLEQVRGTMPVDPARLPLARHLAENLASQRAVLVTNGALLLLFTGQLISSPSPWRWGMVIVFGLIHLAVTPLILRNERQARRFLAEHPGPGSGG